MQKDGCPSPAWVSIVNGSVVNDGTLQLGCPFYWANPSSPAVSVQGCGGFCTQDTYTVPAPPVGEMWGLKEATLLGSVTSWTFGPEVPNKWNAGGVPRIGNPPDPDAKEDRREKREERKEKEVA